MTVHADRPTEPSVAGATATHDAPPPSRRLGRSLPAVAVLVLLVLLAAVPLFLAPFEANTLSRILVFALFAVSLDLLVGITGLPSLGHAAYFGVGAYTAGLVSIHWTSEAPVPVLLAAVAGAVAAAATGWLAVRSGGVYFLMLTLAIGELVHQLAQSLSDVTGGSNGLFGIPSVRVGGEPLTLAGYVYWYILAVALLGFLGLWLVAHSPFGGVLRASGTTSRECGRWATPPSATSSSRSRSPAASPAWPAACWPAWSASSTRATPASPPAP